MRQLFGGLFALVGVYLVSVLVIWLLSLIGPISATVEGVIERGGGTIWFAAAGLAALFIIISGIGLVFVYLIAKKVPSVAAAMRALGTSLQNL
jgi:hypothetical protein